MNLSSRSNPQAVLDQAAASARVLGGSMVLLGGCTIWVTRSRVLGVVLRSPPGVRTAVFVIAVVYLLLGPGLVYFIVPTFIRARRPQAVMAAAWTAFGQSA